MVQATQRTQSKSTFTIWAWSLILNLLKYSEISYSLALFCSFSLYLSICVSLFLCFLLNLFRGLLALQTLHKLEAQTGKPIYQLFDYICGVSTGKYVLPAPAPVMCTVNWSVCTVGRGLSELNICWSDPFTSFLHLALTVPSGPSDGCWYAQYNVCVHGKCAIFWGCLFWRNAMFILVIFHFCYYNW